MSGTVAEKAHGVSPRGVIFAAEYLTSVCVRFEIVPGLGACAGSPH